MYKLHVINKAKIEVIQNLPLPATIRDLPSFLEHVGFYQRFIQDFAKVSKPLTTLLCKDTDFIIDEERKRAFVMLKQALIQALILQSPNWDLIRTQNVVITTHGLLLYKPIKLLNTLSPLLSHNLTFVEH